MNRNPQKPNRSDPTNGGFTLVEILIVVLLLGIIAAIALPRFSNASSLARGSMLADNLRLMRMQLEVFKCQHRGAPPGYPGGDPTVAPTFVTFSAHMTQGTNENCDVGVPGGAGFPFGPYFRELPTNPLNDKSTVQIIGNAEAFPIAGDDSHGYIYQPFTLIFKADSPGVDQDGKLYFEY